jgi:organic radical activating enzyme
VEKVLTRSVEVNLTAHCNLSCYGCDHASPARDEGYLDLDVLKADLAALSEVYHVFEFFLTGGEPLLHPRLLDVIDTIRDSGIADRIAVVTNGVLLHRAPAGIWDRIDKIWVSLYPGVKRKLSNEEIRGQARRSGVLLNLKVTDSFTDKLVHAENEDPELVRSIYSTCTLRTSCHTIHEGRFYKCSPSPFVPEWVRRVGGGSVDFSGDGIPLRDNPDLRNQLEAYLRNEEPLSACRYCLGAVGKELPARQMNKRAVAEWLAEPARDPAEQLDRPALAAARSRLAGRDLSGIQGSLFWLRVRWRLVQTLRRISGIDLTGASPLALRSRLRAAATVFQGRRTPGALPPSGGGNRR